MFPKKYRSYTCKQRHYPRPSLKPSRKTGEVSKNRTHLYTNRSKYIENTFTCVYCTLSVHNPLSCTIALFIHKNIWCVKEPDADLGFKWAKAVWFHSVNPQPSDPGIYKDWSHRYGPVVPVTSIRDLYILLSTARDASFLCFV